jgi:hypothetical protein
MGVSHVTQPVKKTILYNKYAYVDLILVNIQCSFPLGPWPFEHARHDKLSISWHNIHAQTEQDT